MKADVSIKWSERAADCPLVEEKSCGLCFWTKPRGLSMTGTLVWGSLMMKSTALLHVHVWLKLVQSSSSQVNLAAFFSRRLSVSEVWSRFRLSCWCLARTSRRFLRFSHESVSAGLWKNHQHQSKAATWVQLREDSVKTATPTGHLLWPHVIMPLLFYSSLSFLVHGQQTSL